MKVVLRSLAIDVYKNIPENVYDLMGSISYGFPDEDGVVLIDHQENAWTQVEKQEEVEGAKEDMRECLMARLEGYTIIDMRNYEFEEFKALH